MPNNEDESRAMMLRPIDRWESEFKPSCTVLASRVYHRQILESVARRIRALVIMILFFSKRTSSHDSP